MRLRQGAQNSVLIGAPKFSRPALDVPVFPCNFVNILKAYGWALSTAIVGRNSQPCLNDRHRWNTEDCERKSSPNCN
jgi:hypothetical protein